MTLRNLGSSAKSVALSVAGGDPGVAFAVSPATATIVPGGTATVNVTMTAGKGAPAGGHQAFLEVGSGGKSVAHAALFTLVK
jgi:uncharacterized membrane protein